MTMGATGLLSRGFFFSGESGSVDLLANIAAEADAIAGLDTTGLMVVIWTIRRLVGVVNGFAVGGRGRGAEERGCLAAGRGRFEVDASGTATVDVVGRLGGDGEATGELVAAETSRSIRFGKLAGRVPTRPATAFPALGSLLVLCTTRSSHSTASCVVTRGVSILFRFAGLARCFPFPLTSDWTTARASASSSESVSEESGGSDVRETCDEPRRRPYVILALRIGKSSSTDVIVVENEAGRSGTKTGTRDFGYASFRNVRHFTVSTISYTRDHDYTPTDAMMRLRFSSRSAVMISLRSRIVAAILVTPSLARVL